MILERFPEVQKLSPEEKLLFLSELWDELDSGTIDLPTPPSVLTELDRRMERFWQHPNEHTTWEEARVRILNSGNEKTDSSSASRK